MPTPRRIAAPIAAALGLLAGLALGSTDARAGDCTVEVEAGDTLGAIAARVGLTQAELLAENPKLAKNPNLLRVGQTLDVCKADASIEKPEKSGKARRCGSGGHVVVHEVDKGDTLSKIAARHGVDEDAIVARNPALKKDRNRLGIGDALEICVDEKAARAPKSALCDNRTPLFVHEVVPGEHLGQIAGRYGVRSSDLQRWNASLAKKPDLLRVGQSIRVCPEIAPRERKRIEYAVAPGDSFGEIAARYELTPRELLRYQQGKVDDPGKLSVGTTLVVWADGGIVPGFGALDDDHGVLQAGMQLAPGKHYHVKWEAAAWGTATTIRAIQAAVSDYKRRMPGGPKVHVGDISKRGGGHFPPHVSHQQGRDVDIGYVLQGDLANETRFRTANAKNLDVARTWRLIKALVDTGDVKYIFMDYKIQKLLYEHALSKGASEDLLDELFQYPRGRGRTHGMIRHWKGHANHFHVRFRE